MNSKDIANFTMFHSKAALEITASWKAVLQHSICKSHFSFRWKGCHASFVTLSKQMINLLQSWPNNHIIFIQLTSHPNGESTPRSWNQTQKRNKQLFLGEMLYVGFGQRQLNIFARATQTNLRVVKPERAHYHKVGPQCHSFEFSTTKQAIVNPAFLQARACRLDLRPKSMIKHYGY